MEYQLKNGKNVNIRAVEVNDAEAIVNIIKTADTESKFLARNPGEFKDKLNLKWPDKANLVYNLYREMDFTFCKSTLRTVGNLRDKKDIPVLSDAIYHNVDLILTGDKDFFEAGLNNPIVCSPAMLLKFIESQ